LVFEWPVLVPTGSHRQRLRVGAFLHESRRRLAG